MRALHYAAYFDVPQLIRVVLQAAQPGGKSRDQPYFPTKEPGKIKGSALYFLVVVNFLNYRCFRWIRWLVQNVERAAGGAVVLTSKCFSHFFVVVAVAVVQCTFWELILYKMILQF